MEKLKMAESDEERRRIASSMWALVESTQPEPFEKNKYYCFTCKADNLSNLKDHSATSPCVVFVKKLLNGRDYCITKKDLDSVSYDTTGIRIYKQSKEDEKCFLKSKRTTTTTIISSQPTSSSTVRKPIIVHCVSCYYRMIPRPDDNVKNLLYCSIECKLRHTTQQQHQQNKHPLFIDLNADADADGGAGSSTKNTNDDHQEPPPDDDGIINLDLTLG